MVDEANFPVDGGRQLRDAPAQFKQEINDSTNSHLVDTVESFVRSGVLMTSNYLTGKLMKDNIYAFSYKKELLDLSAEDLGKRDDVRLKYI